jgi:hypothetical protein
MSWISSGARGSGFHSLEQTLYQELNDKFLVLRVDAASGVSFYDAPMRQELLKSVTWQTVSPQKGRCS